MRKSKQPNTAKVQSLHRRHGNPRYFVSTLAKALDVLEALAEVDSDVGLTELAKRVHLSTPTLFRILSTLQARGYVQKNVQTSLYRLALKTWEVGTAAFRRLAIREVARPWIEKLVKELGETVHLAVLQGLEVIFIDKLDSPQPVKVDTDIGRRAPAHCTATGKAILPFKSRETLTELFSHKLKRFTEKTICDRTQLEREFALIQQNKYAMNREEWRDGVSAIGVPIWNHAGEVVAALSITTPTERFSEERVQRQFIPALMRAGQAISQELGFRSVSEGESLLLDSHRS
jgi:DNA-binding IclR family transcriptional regulator